MSMVLLINGNYSEINYGGKNCTMWLKNRKERERAAIRQKASGYPRLELPRVNTEWNMYTSDGWIGGWMDGWMDEKSIK